MKSLTEVIVYWATELNTLNEAVNEAIECRDRFIYAAFVKHIIAEQKPK